MSLSSAQSPDSPPKLNPAGGYLEFSLTTEYQEGPSLVQVLMPDRLEPEKRYPVLYNLPVESGTKSEFGSGMAEDRRDGSADHGDYLHA